MAAYIPFVNTAKDCDILDKHYQDAHMVRVSLESIDNVETRIPRDRLWLDPGIDGYEHHLKNKTIALPLYLRTLPSCNVLANEGNFKTPNKGDVKNLVDALLDKCCNHRPQWLTVPQLPVVDNTSRNKMNTQLAQATCDWRIRQQYAGKLILPIVFTNQGQLTNKSTHWQPRVDSAIKCYKIAGADGVWVVDSSLSDQKGTATFKGRFRVLIDLHEYVTTQLQGAEIIAGPYWGLNLILWAKAVCDHPAISLGTGYQYHLSGSPFRRKGKSRIAIPPLKRWVDVSPQFQEWLRDALNRLSSKDQAFKNLKHVQVELQQELGELQLRDELLEQDANREQISLFYKEWLATIEDTPETGRALALYQDFSSAYVLGKHLPTLPASGNTARRPEKVAEYFMLNCL